MEIVFPNGQFKKYMLPFCEARNKYLFCFLEHVF